MSEEYDILDYFIRYGGPDEFLHYLYLDSNKYDTGYRFDVKNLVEGKTYLIVNTVTNDSSTKSSTSYFIGKLMLIRKLRFFEGTYTFKDWCEIKDGKIVKSSCKKTNEIIVGLGNVNSKLNSYLFYPIMENTKQKDFIGYFDHLSPKERITASRATSSLPRDLQRNIFSYIEGPTTPGPFTIPSNLITSRVPNSMLETREPDPNESAPTEEDVEKLTGTKSYDSKGGKKSRRRRRRRSSSRKNRKTHRRHRK